jgi:hypothetical protein
VLLVPALWWARKARKNPATPGAGKVGKADLVMTVVVVTVMFGPLTARIWADDTRFGQWVSTDAGSLTYLAAVFAAVVILGLLLRWLARIGRLSSGR